MVADKFDFGFAVDWMRKDLSICAAEARANGAALPVTALVDQFYARVQAMGGARWDTSSLIRVLATRKRARARSAHDDRADPRGGIAASSRRRGGRRRHQAHECLGAADAGRATGAGIRRHQDGRRSDADRGELTGGEIRRDHAGGRERRSGPPTVGNERFEVPAARPAARAQRRSPRAARHPRDETSGAKVPLQLTFVDEKGKRIVVETVATVRGLVPRSALPPDAGD